jgi:glycosyltransferase involved in cell wall biosynthesis
MANNPLAGINILYITEHFGPGLQPVGGANNVLRSVALESNRLGAEAVVMIDSLRKSAPPEKRWQRDGLKVYKFPLIKSVTKNYRKIGRTALRQYLTKAAFSKVTRLFHPDLVYLTMYGGELRSAFEMKKRYGSKTIVSAQALDLHLFSKGRYEQVEYTPEWKDSVESVDTWIPCAPLVYERLANWGIPEKKLIPIYNAVDVPEGLPESAHAPETQSALKIVYAGRVIIQKGILDLVNAVAELTRIAPHIRPRLQIVGGYTSEIQRLIKDRIETVSEQMDCELVGEVASERIQEIVSNAHVFCHPSMFPYEGLPLATLEAGAYGCPMILSEHPAHLSVYTPEVHALYCKTGDPREFAQTILRLVKDRDLRRNVRENAYTLVKQKFNRIKMLDRYMSLFQHLLKRT